MSLDWYPLDYNNLDQKTPIVCFLLGSFGVSEDGYVKELALLVKNLGWRLVILNRRGWDKVPLKNEKFIH